MTSISRLARNLSLTVAALIAATAAAHAADAWSPRDIKAAEALVVDGETGAVLFERNADKSFPPASLAKLMTMEVVFEALDKHKVRPDQTFAVSDHAWRTGGAPSGSSTMFAKLRSQVPLDALMRGVIVQAANDAAIVIAEGMAGSEEAFAGLMNDRARQLGLAGSTFVNPTGLPAPGQHVTARDLASLARHIEETYPDLYRIYSEPQFEWNKITQRNRNPLLGEEVGATGMGTGFIEASGYSLLGVTEQEGRKTFVVLAGLPTVKDRQDEARRMIEWSNGAFRRDVLFEAGAAVGKAAVYGGLQPEIDVVTRDPLVAFLPTDKPERVKARVVYDWPLRAPIDAGQKVGRIEVTIDDGVSLVRDVFAANKVEQGSFAGRAFDAAQELAIGWIKAL